VVKEEKDPEVWPGVTIKGTADVNVTNPISTTGNVNVNINEDTVGIAKDSTLSSALPRLSYGYEYDTSTWYPIKVDTSGKVHIITERPQYSYSDTFSTDTRANYIQIGDTLNWDSTTKRVYYEGEYSGAGTWMGLALVKNWCGDNIRCRSSYFLDEKVTPTFSTDDWWVHGVVIRCSGYDNFIIAGSGGKVPFTFGYAPTIVKVVNGVATIIYHTEEENITECEVIMKENMIIFYGDGKLWKIMLIKDEELQGPKLFGFGYIHHNAGSGSYYKRRWEFWNFYATVKGEKDWV